MREYQLADYENALSNFHIKRSDDLSRAQTPHFHDYYQIYFVSQGKLMYHIGDISKELSVGDAALVPPLTTHWVDNSINAEFYAVSFQTTFFPREWMDGSLGEFLASVRDCSRPLPLLTLTREERARLSMYLHTMLSEFRLHEIGYVGILQGLLNASLTQLARAWQALPEYAAHTERQEVKRQSILSCTERMKADLSRHTSLDEEAHISLMSRAQFCKAFQEVTGTSFVKYRTRLRIDRAASMLRENTHPIEQIAAYCGFPEYSSFYRCFVEIIGMSPANYRKIGDSRRPPVYE